VLPLQLQADAIEVGMAENRSTFERELIALHDETEPAAPYVFMATEYPAREEAAPDSGTIRA
jgi:hypothetical protein